MQLALEERKLPLKRRHGHHLYADERLRRTRRDSAIHE